MYRGDLCDCYDAGELTANKALCGSGSHYRQSNAWRLGLFIKGAHVTEISDRENRSAGGVPEGMLWLVIYALVLFTIFYADPIRGTCFVASVLGFWLAAGSGEVWLRSVVSMLALGGMLIGTASISTGIEGEQLDELGCLLLAYLVASLVLTWMLSWALPWGLRVPPRLDQVLLKDIGGWMVLLGLIFAFIRSAVHFDKDLQKVFAWNWQSPLIMIVPTTLAVCLTCSWQLLPGKYRSSQRANVILLLAILVGPLISTVVLDPSADMGAGRRMAFFVILHSLIGFGASLMVWLLELAGFFSPEQRSMNAQSGNIKDIAQEDWD